MVRSSSSAVLSLAMAQGCTAFELSEEMFGELDHYGGYSEFSAWAWSPTSALKFRVLTHAHETVTAACFEEASSTGNTAVVGEGATSAEVLMGGESADTGVVGGPNWVHVRARYEAVSGALEFDVSPADSWGQDDYWDFLGGGSCAVVELTVRDMVLRPVGGDGDVLLSSFSFAPIGVGGSGWE